MRAKRAAFAALVGAGAMLVGGGVALAERGDGDRRQRCDDRIARVAERRGVSAEELRARIEARLAARVDRALAAGRISSVRAARLKERIADGRVCARPALAIRLAKRGLLRAAARYLELTAAQLREQLPGTSLAALAATEGKSIDGLTAALLAPAQSRLERAVERGRISRERAAAALERLEAAVDRLVTRTFPAR